MKNFFGSIANRMFVILLAGMLLATAVTMLLAGREREHAIDDMRLGHAADRIEQLVLAIDNAAPAARPVILQTVAGFGMQGQVVPAAVQPDAVVDTDHALITLLKNRLGKERSITALSRTNCALSPQFERARSADRAECHAVLIALTNGESLRVQLRPPPMAHGRLRAPMTPSTPYLALFLGLIALLAYAVARMTARPIQNLAAAAGALGSDLDRAPLIEAGPTEIRQAAAAFNAMQARIRRQVQHRTHMLAAITHDLQTPLTRLRLRLEKVSEPDLRDKLIGDLGQMQSMVREGLELARSMDSQEPLQRLDINSLVDSVCADASDAGHEVQLLECSGLFVMAQPNALRRCLTNLLDNAIKYGKSAQVSITQESPERVRVRIHDAGPGLPPDQMEAVFDPFFRLETSRSRDTGGTGLGLTIARNIAENHAGTLVLRNHPDGGLEALLTLPLIHFQSGARTF
jgi:signal transduction histidine kinase